MAYENNAGGYGKRSLWFWILIYVAAALVVYGAVYFIFFAGNNSLYKSPVSPVGTNQNVKFADSSDANNSYLISTDTYDTATQKALSGFKVDRTVLADGTQRINLTSTNPEYQNQSYIVAPGQKLYFVERNLQDDSNSQENNLGDDTAVLVDANGFIVK
jgi:hypothetical protein